ncbi:LUD domain-containing protein [Paenibacillus thiaminolyticus]|uniref:LutC/YkgG family protein n=1 Tax=Paenibacillus thiaminolyticus TaxID=49283 RepID=UPI003D29BE5F
MDRHAFLAMIASRLGRSGPLTEAPAHLYRGVPGEYRDRMETLNAEERLQLFVSNWTALTGEAVIVPREEAAAGIEEMLARFRQRGPLERVLYADTEELRGYGVLRVLQEQGLSGVPWADDRDNEAELEPLGLSEPGEAGALAGAKWQARSPLLRAAERCQIGIVAPAAAIANTGTLAVWSAGRQGRSVSLLPGMLLAILPAERIVARMGEAFERVNGMSNREGGLPASLNLITGPSRSADIENDLTIGVHGPGVVGAVILTSDGT